MLFYINQFNSEQGTLGKVWLAAFWQGKVTKADVLQCSVESAVKEIKSLELNVGMRTYGHLLLGVVRILSRKAEYLHADSSEALVKINMTFRPGLTGAPVNTRAMTLTEDFTCLDSSMPEMSDSDCFSHHQSRPEEITLKDDLGNNFLNFVASGKDLTFPSLAFGEDGFGDEGNEHELLAFLESCSDHAVDFLHKEPPDQNSKNLSLHEKQDVDTVEPVEAENSTLNKEASHLKPVAAPVNMEEKKRLRRKRKLVVDHVKELSTDTIRKQIADYSDLLAPMEMAPPTRTLMQWMERGSANNLFSQMCSSVDSSTIKEFFSRCLMMESPDVDFGVEEVHQEKLRAAEQREDNSVRSSLGDSPPLTTPELPSEDSLCVQPSAEPPDTLSTQSAVNYQEFMDSRITQRAWRIHRVLKKLEVVQLYQNATYGDILITPGPRF
ncbi:double-strand-break repair protein rad21-like protein 1 isoform X2 [Synchiropus splendidus]|uniref:double-strand-break repair protein rad21-like protein 1 isoform X2 n=1 Tax=Synchiropus splendidus TaxID=270530 RepID=UPI00237DF642|nr:double-strand-break repair protein rad21-like protein 1 isoform X2 [Synchiropus splendidus]